MVEDFYLEIRAGLSKYDYQLAKYNFLRDALIERFEGDESEFDENYAEQLGVTRKEMFDNVRSNTFVFAFAIRSNAWGIAKISDYQEYVKEGRAKVSFPIAS